jgi:hypothetical protein
MVAKRLIRFAGMSKSDKRGPTMQELFPKLSVEQLGAVEETLHRFCEIALRILDRLEHEQSSKKFDEKSISS